MTWSLWSLRSRDHPVIEPYLKTPALETEQQPLWTSESEKCDKYKNCDIGLQIMLKDDCD
jgi:hypothetical protein